MINHKTWCPPGGCPVKAWVDGIQFEVEAQEQIHKMSQLPFVGPHIVITPDVHAGKGSVVGSVIPTQGAIVPSFTGADIGCGMRFALTNLKVGDIDPGTYPAIRASIAGGVPQGRTDNGGKNDRGAWGCVPSNIEEVWNKYLVNDFASLLQNQKLSHPMVQNQLGTLGTGNHFLEVSVDELDRIWLVVHSGSRGIGSRIGTVFVKAAKELMEKWFITLPDPELAYLPEGTPEFGEYIRAVQWAQRYAKCSRKIMLDHAMVALRSMNIPVSYLEEHDCHHNFLEKERHFGKDYWITRKGAIRAREDDISIIPGNMASKSYVVRGKGNRDSFTSCSHGAGRVMSRTQARKTFTVEDHVKATEGVECKKDEGIIDETPGSYKPIDAVMKAQEDLVEVLHTLKALICIKG